MNHVINGPARSDKLKDNNTKTPHSYQLLVKRFGRLNGQKENPKCALLVLSFLAQFGAQLNFSTTSGYPMDEKAQCLF